MQKFNKLGIETKKLACLCLNLTAILLLLHLTASATPLKRQSESKLANSFKRDTTVAEMFRSQIPKHKYDLFYPQSVKRFYEKNGYKLAFVAPETVKTHAGDAMMFLDCLVQYGLNAADYHSRILTYNKLNALVKLSSTAGIKQKVFFDMMLTDAMIALINNLHHGKLNPYYTTSAIDSGKSKFGFLENTLQNAILAADFESVIQLVQPKSAAYQKLQKRMHLITGLYETDCYETPDSTIRLMAINMERLRWLTHDSTNYIDINLPASTMALHLNDSTRHFKVNIGSPATPTPVLKGIINYFNVGAGGTAESKKIIFPISGYASPYLLDMANNTKFKFGISTATKGNIQIEHAQQLAEMLLVNNGPGYKYTAISKKFKKTQAKTYNLDKGIEIIINYITCEVRQGEIITYNDIYNLDSRLTLQLYGLKNQYAVKTKKDYRPTHSR